MGKKTGEKEIVNLLPPKEQHTHLVASYFPHNLGNTRSGHNDFSADNMVAEQMEMEGVDGTATKADLQQLEAAIIEKFTDKLAALLKLLQGQLDGIKAAVVETKKIADCVMELAFATQDGSRTLQYDQTTFGSTFKP